MSRMHIARRAEWARTIYNESYALRNSLHDLSYRANPERYPDGLDQEIHLACDDMRDAFEAIERVMKRLDDAVETAREQEGRAA